MIDHLLEIITAFELQFLMMTSALVWGALAKNSRQLIEYFALTSVFLGLKVVSMIQHKFEIKFSFFKSPTSSSDAILAEF